jgi:predicted amino acid dehydrogenase
MTFKDRLVGISNSIDFELFIADHCAKIKEAMEAAAHAGYRTFQIDVVQPLMNQKVLEANAVNCYTITCKEIATKNATTCALIAKSVEEYLNALGFDELADSTTISNACWLTIVMKVEW